MTDQTATRQLSAAAILLLIACVFGVYQQGAYFQWQHLSFAVLVCIAGALLLVNSDSRRQLARSAIVTAPLLTASGVSLLAASEKGDAGSTFATIGLITIAIAVGRSIAPADSDLALDVFLGIVGIVAVTAIWGVATHTTPWGRMTGGIWRGSSSITYANAAAALLGPATLVSFWKAERTRSLTYAVYSTISLIAFASTQSRGGALALLFGGLLLAKHLGLSRTVTTSVPIVAGAAVGSSALLFYAADARATSPALVLGIAAVGCLATGALWRLDLDVRRSAPVAALGIAAAVGVALTTSLGDRLTLSSPTTSTGPDGAVLLGDRAQTWVTAWQRFSESPLIGNGPGNVDLSWIEDERSFSALFVHNEYLELLVTHGLLGAVAFFASAALLLRDARPTDERSIVGIAILTFMAHSAFDYLWHIPALPVTMAVLAGIATREIQSKSTTQEKATTSR